MHSCRWLIIFLAIFSTCAPPGPVQIENQPSRPTETIRGHRRLLAVLDFENQTGTPESRVGDAVTDKLISQLAQTNRFILMERSKITAILDEQALAQAGLINEITTAQTGQLLGVQGLVLGSVVEMDERFESGEIGEEAKQWSFKLNASVARVAIQYRVVDVVTDQVLFSDDVFKREVKPTFGLKTKDYDFSNLSELDQTLVGKALQKAVREMAVNISRQANRLTWYGKILKATETAIFFTPGQDAGIQAGEIFEVQSREKIETNAENITTALIQVTGFVQEQVCRAKLVNGSLPDAGDWVLEFSGELPVEAEKR